jgi:hypothetical protein
MRCFFNMENVKRLNGAFGIYRKMTFGRRIYKKAGFMTC